MTPSVTVLVPVFNGMRWLDAVFAAIDAARGAATLEILAVDDGSTDGSREWLAREAAAGRLRLIDGPRRGAAAALNAGIRAASHDLVAQIDQDVVVCPGWLDALLEPLGDPRAAAAQGHYVAPRGARLWSRVMGLDLALRYAALGRETDHVCTGNSVYRRRALVEAGLFDEALGYGYDNDMSYRLAAAGHRLAFCRGARSVHHWRDTLAGYVRQRSGYGYGRLDLVAKHRGRLAGDAVSRAGMMLHAPVMLAAVALAFVSLAGAVAGLDMRAPGWTATALAALIAAERTVAGARAALRFRDPAGLAFPVVHLVRDAAWAAAIVTWIARRLSGRRSRPAHSMPAGTVGPLSAPRGS